MLAWLFGWLAGWLMGGLMGGLVGWLVVWWVCLVGRLVACLLGWLAGGLVGWLVAGLLGLHNCSGCEVQAIHIPVGSGNSHPGWISQVCVKLSRVRNVSSFYLSLGHLPKEVARRSNPQAAQSTKTKQKRAKSNLQTSRFAGGSSCVSPVSACCTDFSTSSPCDECPWLKPSYRGEDPNEP